MLSKLESIRVERGFGPLSGADTGYAGVIAKFPSNEERLSFYYVFSQVENPKITVHRSDSNGPGGASITPHINNNKWSGIDVVNLLLDNGAPIEMAISCFLSLK